MFVTGQAEIERACKDLFKRSEQFDYEHDVRTHARALYLA